MPQYQIFDKGDLERRILATLVVDDVVLGRVAADWKKQPFRSPWCNIVAAWCVEYFQQYQQAPRRALESRFATWMDKNPDNQNVKLIEDFLVRTSEEHEQRGEPINPDYMTEVVRQHFRVIALIRTKDAIGEDIDSGRIEAAEEKMVSYARQDTAAQQASDIFIDREAIQSTFVQSLRDPLFDYPGALGQFFQNVLERDCFLSFLAPQKTGKTFWLMDMAWRAMLKRRRVAFFEIGDLSEYQIKMRFYSRAAKHPSRSFDGKWPTTIDYPVEIQHPRGADTAEVTCKAKVFAEPLNAQIAEKACVRVMYKDVRSKDSYFKLSCHDNLDITVTGIQSIIHSWELDNWCPDVIIIDYADNLAPINPRADTREQVNVTWKKLRSLARKFRCLVVTATQSNVKGFEQRILDRRNFSEDNRKLNQVTGMIGINVNDEEREKCSSRLNWINLREAGFNSQRCVHVATCLPLANPAVISCF